jgi:uncharacterized protein YprB with RNaseH-like and TPR domain
MFSEAIRQRLESLNREPLSPLVSAVAAARPIVARKRPPTVQSPGAVSPLRPGLVKPIPGLIRRGDVVNTEFGAHLRICLPLDELWGGGERIVGSRHQYLSRTVPKESTNAAFINAFPHRVLLLDLETCGLSGSALFLVGLLRRVDNRLIIELLLARDYSEEAAVLASLWQRVHADGVVVTFNGKSFDWPMLIDRSRRHLLFRGGRPPAPLHIDLLHAARRRWKKQLPDCKLQTLERHICGRFRTGDIPGSQIPAAYQQFVRTGFEREMDAILLHNAIDLVTLLDLAMRLAGAPC